MCLIPSLLLIQIRKKIRLNRKRRSRKTPRVIIDYIYNLWCHPFDISGSNDDVIEEDETAEEESENINAASGSGDLVTEGTIIIII